jgi:hypothetical protein
MDFLIPTSMEIPDVEIVHLETPSDVFANYRGVGEGGMIAAPAAITNAIEDALAHLGVRVTEQHLPPTRILELAGVIPVTPPLPAPPVRAPRLTNGSGPARSRWWLSREQAEQAWINRRDVLDRAMTSARQGMVRLQGRRR